MKINKCKLITQSDKNKFKIFKILLKKNINIQKTLRQYFILFGND